MVTWLLDKILGGHFLTLTFFEISNFQSPLFPKNHVHFLSADSFTIAHFNMRHPVGRKKSQKRIRNLTLLLATSEYLQGLMCQQFSTYLFLFLGLCKTNQECIKLRDCPYTKKLLTKVFSSSSRAKKNNLIAEIRKLICKPSDRSVCCDIEGYEEETVAEGDHEEHYENKFTKTFRP